MGPPREGEVEVHGYGSFWVWQIVYQTGYYDEREWARFFVNPGSGRPARPAGISLSQKLGTPITSSRAPPTPR
jgi:hypothetical protein